MAETLTHISLAHGNGGRLMRQLIEEIVQHHLANPLLDSTTDAVSLPVDEGELLFTTDGFAVQPLEFPGGDIGSLAVHGSCNDLAVAGALPRYLSLGAIIEEGLPVAQLERIIASLGVAAREAGVVVVTGDTKVVPRGEGGGLYLTTSAIGRRDPRHRLAITDIAQGDQLLVSGPVGDHGTAVMLARGEFDLQGTIRSDSAHVYPLTSALFGLDGLRFMRDPTRGGLATVCHEIIHATGHTLRLEQAAIPLRDAVTSVCEILGYDPLYLACEGRVVAVVAADQAEQALSRWHALPQGCDAAIIGEVVEPGAQLILRTELGGERLLEELENDPLPRIC